MSLKDKFGRGISIALAVALLCGAAQAKRYMLYTDATLAQAGVITPSVQEAHYYEEGEVVTITAQPYNGYDFVCWIGDVESPQSRTTKVVMDGPRYIVASFQVLESNDSIELGIKSLEEGGVDRSISTGAIASSSITQTNYSSNINSYLAAADRPSNSDAPEYTDTTAPDYRRPTGLTPNPIIPEPATITLLVAGAAGIAARRMKKKDN
ncbi:MAG: PEP-CTERM sorting domain-containing protein [Phycisphaerae bacterium]|jgi:hypothetical protein